MQSDPASILIVDDEPQVCSLIRDGLANSGIKCITATDPLEAKQLIDRLGLAVLVTDICMPNISGIDLLAHTKKNRPGCRVILITGTSDTNDLADALRIGAYDYFQKPFDIGSLIDAVTEAISGESTTAHLPMKAARAMQLEARMGEISLENVKALVHTVEAKDPYTRRHSEQVTHYATHLWGGLNFPENSLESIRTASLLHDIGKIGVPDHILTKPDKLTDQEFGFIRRHPSLGAEILENISSLATEAHFVRHHHEKWDGTGYPSGLAGEEIPLASRIINIADSIDAMLMKRTYKQAYSIEKMLGELVRCAGSQFDPALIPATIKWCRKNPGKMICPPSLVA